MEQILNIDKAIEIAQKHHVIYDDYYDSIQECIESCREAMQWKDEKHEQEKQQLIENACEWINDNINSYLDWYDWGKCRVSKDELIDDFRKSMKGE